MRVVFFGTPEPASVALETLLDSMHEVVAVVTQPDRPKGRSGTPVPSPAKEKALAAGLPVVQPSSARDEGFAEELARFAPDVCAVVAYGHILPTDVLAVPARGFVNVHFSLLPKYRGAAPVQRAVMAGEIETGVTTFLLEPTLDTGPILSVARERISPEDTSATLMERLAAVGARLLVDTLDAMEAGTLQPQPQDAALASPAPKIKPEEGLLDWSRPAEEMANVVRGLNPAPGAYTTFRGKRLKIWRASPAGSPEKAQPGAVLPADKEAFVAATGDGALALLEVQLEGGKRLAAEEFVRGYAPKKGEILGS
ncbi:MAG: methionyl-tRNA formyltransferase [Actinomycetota bacterium]